MKKIYFLLAALALTTVSCENFLDTEPIDKIDIHQYYSDEQGLMNGLAGVYDAQSNAGDGGAAAPGLYQDALWTNFNACTDEGFYARNTQTTGIMVNNYDTSNSNVANLWTSYYLGIDRANELIANINIPQMDETKRQIILGEALFLRAYYHFQLISYFGNIPLKLTPTTTPNEVFITQTPAKEVYAQILKDMTDAESKVATYTTLGSPGRVTKTVVQGILARVCLQMAGYPFNDTSKYADALAWTKKVQTSGEHALNTTFDTSLSTPSYVVPNPSGFTVNAFNNNAYAQLFINLAQDKYTAKESMWEIEFKGNRTDGYTETGRLGNTIGIPLSNATFNPIIGMSYGFITGTARLFKAYQPGDLRRDWALAPFTYTVVGTAIHEKPLAAVNLTTDASTYRSCGKFRRKYEIGQRDTNHTNENFPVLRYADILLMLAESENQVNGPSAIAYDAVNQVRRRGYGLDINTPSVTADLPAGLSKANFQLAVENERMLELCFEGTRRLDLIRWNKLIPVMKSVATEIAASQNTGIRYGALGGQLMADRYLLCPIPLKELSVNKKLVQNPLWN